VREIIGHDTSGFILRAGKCSDIVSLPKTGDK